MCSAGVRSSWRISGSLHVRPPSLESVIPGEGFDVVADASGNEHGIDAGLHAIRKGGHYVQVGLTGKPISLDIDLNAQGLEVWKDRQAAG